MIFVQHYVPSLVASALAVATSASYHVGLMSAETSRFTVAILAAVWGLTWLAGRVREREQQLKEAITH